MSTVHGTIGRAAKTQERLTEARLQVSSTRPKPNPHQQEQKDSFWRLRVCRTLSNGNLWSTNIPLEDCKI